jgi:PAS domain S-box-containing protein
MTEQRVMPKTQAKRVIFASLLLVAFAGFNAESAEPRRVLLLHSFGREFEPFITFSESFRSELARQSPEPLDFFDVALGGARFEASEEAPFVDYLLALFEGHRVHLVVPMGGPACRFAQKHRERLFPDTPLLLASVEQRMFQSSMLTSNDAVLSVRHDPQFMVEAILRLLPATTNIVVVFGNSPLEKFWTEVFNRAIQSLTTRVGSESFSELSFAQMKKRAATLPPHSVMIYGQVLVDADGVPQTEEHALRTLHAVANAPIFGIHDYQLGRGIVGGPLVSVRELSHRSALAAARILDGEAPASFRPPPVGPGAPTYDWRELRRWGIAERALPRGSRVQFREPTIWERYRRWIMAGMSALVAEGAIIALLLVNLVKRRRAEANLRTVQERMELAAEAAHLGMWVWDFPRDSVWLSDKCSELFAFGKNREVTREMFLRRVHPEDREAVEQSTRLAIAGKASYRAEYRLLRPDQTLRWIAASGRVDFDSAGNPLRMLGICIDTSEQHRAEEAAREVSGRLIHAQEDERRRIARDLHDDLNQQLALILVEMELFGHEKAATGSQHRDHMEQVAARLRGLCSELHKLSYRLHPVKLDQLGLSAAARSLCGDLSKQCGIRIDFSDDNVPQDIPAEVSLCLYRVIQESLQNMIRHSGAREARVQLRFASSEVSLSIKDAGKGFDLEAARRGGGLGLMSMEERVRLVRGSLAIYSRPGGGTRIDLRVPLSKAASSRQMHGGNCDHRSPGKTTDYGSGSYSFSG